MRAVQFGCLVAVGASLWACAAQRKQWDEGDWTKAPPPTASAEDWRDSQTLFNDGSGDVDHFEGEPQGVRHDLTLRDKAKPDARCTCLDVAVGRPSDSRFGWAEGRPRISPEAIVLALRTDNSLCPNGREGRRPSIQAVDVQGDNVVVVVEELGRDRPQALGAIIKKPGPGGSVYVRPRRYRKRKLPYAHSADRYDRCRIYAEAEAGPG